MKQYKGFTKHLTFCKKSETSTRKKGKPKEKKVKEKGKRNEYERAMKDKGKGKVDEGAPSTKKPLSPQPPSLRPMSPLPTPQVQIQPQVPVASALVPAKILSRNKKIKEQLGNWLSEEAKAKHEEEKQRDQRQAEKA